MRVLASLALLVLAVAAAPGQSHNNPSFEKSTVLEIAVEASSSTGGAHAGPFALDLPKNAIQLHYAVQSAERSAIRFSIARGGEILAAGLGDGGKSKILRGDGLMIVEVTGATESFTLQIIAELLVRKTSG